MTFATAAALSLALPSLAWAAPPGAPSPDSADFPRWVMEYQDDLYRGDQSHGLMEMKVKTAHWTRALAMEMWSKGKDYSLIRILAPKKEKGTATLKAKDDLFTYLGKTGRTIKISGGMRGGSWMGSHFTNDDLVKSSRFSEDYVITTTFNGTRAGVAQHEFTLTPKPDAAVVWGKIVVSVRQEDYQPIAQIFYDEDGEKVRSMEFGDYREVGGRLMPTVMTIRPLDGSGEYTRVTWKKFSFDVDLDSNFFSLQKLKSM
jgi:hypothetical protein